MFEKALKNFPTTSTIAKDFLRFFAAKLGHLNINDFFLYVTKHSNKTVKIGKKEKKFYRIGSWSCIKMQ